MTSNRKRPVYLNLLRIHLPVAGMASIAHRVTGVLLIVASPFLLYGLDYSLRDADSFARLTQWLDSTTGRGVFIALAAVFAQHFAAGVRHLWLSLGLGVSPVAAAVSAWATFVFTLVVTALALVANW